MNYYNEIDPYCVEWLKNLIQAGEIPNGVVDSRSIEDVCPHELSQYTQCHFFAGIGGWPLALRLAGWPDDYPVWTGSCPCQPFSTAGKGIGFADERHLWPAWFHLISECRPPIIFGEQVATASKWLANVYSDMEGMEYTVGAMPIPAGCENSDHERNRLWFVAYSVKNGFHWTGLSSKQRESISRAPGSLNAFPWPTHPMPADTKNFRDVLLLPDGVPDDLASIAAYGNAIVPHVAEKFIRAFIATND
jgi:DNA (cytosine-5)-methyltransferase 1